MSKSEIYFLIISWKNILIWINSAFLYINKNINIIRPNRPRRGKKISRKLLIFDPGHGKGD